MRKIKSRHAVCHGWQVTDLAHENINSAMSLLEVAIVAADDGGVTPKDPSGSFEHSHGFDGLRSSLYSQLTPSYKSLKSKKPLNRKT